MHFNALANDMTPVTEMAIVDVFTRLIFADEGVFSPREEMIVQSLRTVDNNVLRDTYSEMGEYLRNLGVSEMIHLVSRVRQQLAEEVALSMSGVSSTDADRLSSKRTATKKH